MGYCRWQNIRGDMWNATGAFLAGNPLNNHEKTAMKNCMEMFVELLQYAHISEEGYREVDLALMDLYTDIEERSEDDDDESKNSNNTHY